MSILGLGPVQRGAEVLTFCCQSPRFDRISRSRAVVDFGCHPEYVHTTVQNQVREAHQRCCDTGRRRRCSGQPVPIYEFRCDVCARFEQTHPMGSAPDTVDCPTCRAPARRLMSAPHLSAVGSAAFGLIDSTARSAFEPEVVESALPGRRSGAGAQFTANPLHRKLPRP
ncbi:zinc ribbon domain-containing protein [Cryobacterium sp. N22]|uniref:FmdB family zinc ribbon protein n=1 Tax=Cryobacterium sp. N22 TaxID=2048290 RepID=UPI002101A197|nr:zinc ribbon domain-containing protein [Cryobacterium sp. N22]